MIPLMQQMEDVTLELELIVAGDENRVAIEAYVIFFEKFVPIIGRLDESCGKRNVLKGIPKAFLEQQLQPINEFNEELSSALATLSILEEKWIEEDFKVTQDDSFDNTIQAMKSLTKMIMDINKIVWNSWGNYLLASFKRTDAELSSIEKIDKYKNKYNDFIRERALFTSKIATLPIEIDQIKDLQELSNRLQGLMQDVDFNIPDDVKIFFDYIDDVVKGKKAPLSLLTPEVLKWIQDNNEMNSFAITRTSGYR